MKAAAGTSSLVCENVLENGPSLGLSAASLAAHAENDAMLAAMGNETAGVIPATGGQRANRLRFQEQRKSGGLVHVQAQAAAQLTYLSQRTTNGHYSSSFAFPGQPDFASKDITDKASLKAVIAYECKGITGCPGGCCLQLESVDVCNLRQNLLHVQPTSELRDKWLEAQLSRAYNRTANKWDKLKVHLSIATTIEVCPSSFGLIHGFTGSKLYSKMNAVQKSSDMSPEASAPAWALPDLGNQVEKATYPEVLLRRYVYEVLMKNGEWNPAPPGTARPSCSDETVGTSGETVLRWRSYETYWQQCKKWFKDKQIPVPGRMCMLKKVMQREKRLHQKTVNSHPTCRSCQQLADAWSAACAMKGRVGKEQREKVRKALQIHESNHMGERSVVDKHCFIALVEPQRVWTIMADGATQRNWRLPRMTGRPSKELVNAPFFNFKLFGTFAPGYGFSPYLVHDSCHTGTDLVWTAIWLTICSMQDHYGYTAHELFIVLDNTTADNKNMGMLYFCGWLVSTGKFRRVRVFFLMVGHTHIVIDQIFGVITSGIKGKELMLPIDLMTSIDSTMEHNTQYQPHAVQWLQTVWQWTPFIKKTCGHVDTRLKNIFRQNNSAVGPDGVIDERYNGMHDFVFFVPTHEREKGDCHLMYRKSSKAEYFEDSTSGFAFFTVNKDGILLGEEPDAHPIQPFSKWGLKKKKTGSSKDGWTLRSTLEHCTRQARCDADKQDLQLKWNQILAGIEGFAASGEVIPGLATPWPDFRVHQLDTDNFVLLDESIDGVDLDNMSNPPVNPVVHKNRSAAQVQQEIVALRGLLRKTAEPTIYANSRVYPGDYLFYSSPSSLGRNVELIKVDDYHDRSTLLVDRPLCDKFRCSRYDISPGEDETPLLWGKVSLTSPVAHVDVCRKDVLVFNVQLKIKSTKGCIVQYKSHQQLAKARPDEEHFKMPSPLPRWNTVDSSDDEAEPVPARRPAAKKKSSLKQQHKRRRTANAFAGGSSASEEEDEEDDESEDEDESEEEEVPQDDGEDKAQASEGSDYESEEVDEPAPVALLTDYQEEGWPTCTTFSHLLLWHMPPSRSGKKDTTSANKCSWYLGRITDRYDKHKKGWTHEYQPMQRWRNYRGRAAFVDDVHGYNQKGSTYGVKLTQDSFENGCFVCLTALNSA